MVLVNANEFICKSYCNILTFHPAQNAIQGDAPEGGDTF